MSQGIVQNKRQYSEKCVPIWVLSDEISPKGGAFGDAKAALSAISSSIKATFKILDVTYQRSR